MSRTLKDYRPQHDERCAIHKCRECGHWRGDPTMHNYGDECNEWHSLPCSCGLDALLHAVDSPAGAETCGVQGKPEAGLMTCELPKGHEGYHQQGHVRWLGYHPGNAQRLVMRLRKMAGRYWHDAATMDLPDERDIRADLTADASALEAGAAALEAGAAALEREPALAEVLAVIEAWVPLGTREIVRDRVRALFTQPPPSETP